MLTLLRFVLVYPSAKAEGYGSGGGRRKTNYYATIEILSVLDWGDGYGEGQEFIFYQLPKYTDRVTDYSTANGVPPYDPTLPEHRSTSGTYNPLSKEIPSSVQINYEPLVEVIEILRDLCMMHSSKSHITKSLCIGL